MTKYYIHLQKNRKQMAILYNLQKFFLSKKNSWLVIAIVLLILLVILQYTRRSIKYEGFQQKLPFTSQRGADIYDEFYAEIHDRLHDTESRSEKEAIEIVKATQPDKENSTFLDVGCGTGCLVNALKHRGYNAIGVDKSKAMIETGKERHPSCKNEMQTGDAMDPMLFERGLFSHVLCMDQTIYEIEDKITFLRNCKYWLQPGGYFILHLVEPDKFNAVVPLGQPAGLFREKVEAKTADGKRITDTAIDFIDFKYKSAYDFSQLEKTGVVTQTEKFIDSTSNKVRQNEKTMHMSSPNSILEDARYCGFLLMGEFVSSADKHQKVVILKAL
jgi:SAM-dependent methyltransferase